MSKQGTYDKLAKMKNSKQNERDAEIAAMGDMTQQEIANKYNITRQRVQQIEKRLGIKRDRSTKIYEYKCRECGEAFMSNYHGRVYCSRECSSLGRRLYRTPEERANLIERVRESRRVRAKKYYHEVLKKKSNWHEIVHKRNEMSALKKKD